jgi:hypothetical protein
MYTIDLWEVADQSGLRRPMNQNCTEYPENQMKLGIEVEMEHTEMIPVAACIAAHHLDEQDNYYEVLKSVGL